MFSFPKQFNSSHYRAEREEEIRKHSQRLQPPPNEFIRSTLNEGAYNFKYFFIYSVRYEEYMVLSLFFSFYTKTILKQKLINMLNNILLMDLHVYVRTHTHT